MWQNITLISLGAALGASSRYGLSLLFNPLFQTLAFGTLVANGLGCLLMGIFLALFIHFPDISPQWKMLLVTGFLGSLTTFSSFSGEVFETLAQGKILQGLMIIFLHLILGFSLTAVGFFVTQKCL